ncbi:MAG: dethiobiotin synthase [Planctomycetaceae bacterium]
MQGLFITGTDTGVGKTWVTCALIKAGLEAGGRMGAYKPACSGAETNRQGQLFWSDVEALRFALGGTVSRERIGPQCFRAPLAPPAAAEAEGQHVDWDRILSGAAAWQAECDMLLVEGAGGWHCPLTDKLTFADLAQALGFPVLVVAANRLGVINHTLLTLEAIRNRGLSVAGVVLCHVSPDGDQASSSHRDLLLRYADLPWLGETRYGEQTIHTRRGRLAGLDWMTPTSGG